MADNDADTMQDDDDDSVRSELVVLAAGDDADNDSREQQQHSTEDGQACERDHAPLSLSGWQEQWHSYEELRMAMLVFLVVLAHFAVAIARGRRRLKHYLNQVLDREDKGFYGVTKGWLVHILNHRRAWMVSKEHVQETVLAHVRGWEVGNLLRLYRAFNHANDSLPAALRIEIDLHDVDLDSLFDGDS